jgi:hypothetical protein
MQGRRFYCACPSRAGRRSKGTITTPNGVLFIRLSKVQAHDQEHRFMKTAQYQTGRMVSRFIRISATLSKLVLLCNEEKTHLHTPLRFLGQWG